MQFQSPLFLKNFLGGICPQTPLGVTKYQLPQTKPKLYAYDYVSVYVPCYYVTCHIKSYLSCHALKIKVLK